ncbi:MAG: transglycosylase family protein [Conexibacteraceae bacterium]|nr:transglycosylase family protein [Conexibacteraceae bacterium]
MYVPARRHQRRLIATVFAAAVCVTPALAGSATGADLSTLNNKLGAAKSQLNATQQREQSLKGSIQSLNSQVSSLASQINLVQSREAAVQARLATYQQKLANTRVAIGRERRRMAHLHKILVRATTALKAELVAEYEQPQQSVVTLLVDAHGFQQLLDRIQYMSRAKQRELSIVNFTRHARDNTQAATDHLTALEHADATAANDATTQSNALAGMNALLGSRRAALADDQAAQSTALANAQAQGGQLQAAIATIQKQQAAAQAAAAALAQEQAQAQQAQQAQQVQNYGGGSASLAPSGGWAIPLAIVLCESGGQNLPPNSAGASGYYQIIPSTWREFGGTGPAAYLTSEAEQSAVATRIWNNGAGAGNWACAAIVGIT